MKMKIKSSLVVISLFFGNFVFAGGDVSTSPITSYPKGIPPGDLIVILTSEEVHNFFQAHGINGVLSGSISAYSACIGNSPIIYEIVGSRTDKMPCSLQIWVGPSQGRCGNQNDLRSAHIERNNCE